VGTHWSSSAGSNIFACFGFLAGIRAAADASALNYLRFEIADFRI
jgi:hypothetical protein